MRRAAEGTCTAARAVAAGGGARMNAARLSRRIATPAEPLFTSLVRR